VGSPVTFMCKEIICARRIVPMRLTLYN
jgi:hypothetical protein